MTEACGSDHCITCSDEAVPMRIEQLDATGLATCLDDEGAHQEVMTELLPDVRAGDRVLVHAGVALTLVTESPEDFR